MFDWLQQPLAHLNSAAEHSARERQNQLTKPTGALGRLEEIAIRLAAMQGGARPCIDPAWISVFAADHGVARAGVSAYPQAVTAQMLVNFVQGGAAVSVLARYLGAALEVIDVGVAGPLLDLPGLIQARAGNGTADLSIEPAMTAVQLAVAMAAGRDAVERAKAAGSRLFIGGEMGIGNTTAAAALACALLAAPAASLVGPGTGLDTAGMAHKCRVVEQALQCHGGAIADVPGALACLGGFEIAALCGAYIRCAQCGLPVLVDGFIAGVAALCAERWMPGVAAWLLFGHRSQEPGHAVVLEALGAKPLLDLSMRLGEGSGAAVALPLLRAACALHNEMATFAEAGVADAIT
ncbi:MAG: nicotinate-nucleotide--dimethylbenzimidazole phosphoribosyltransferase [Methylococcaceae bacterium]|nr:MAG: nicotinate-nucleotide--dimethylbenzimidazole phosphoribosyltransferase [Methylococcaceae bacterium]